MGLEVVKAAAALARGEAAAGDRIAGDLDLQPGDSGDPPWLFGDGLVEYWIDVPREQAYRFYLRYASPGFRPCDLVIDGEDLHPYHMAARNRTLSPAPRDTLWELQGARTLSAGLHWIRLQDVLPEIVGLRLEPVAAGARPAIPWERYAVPDGSFLTRAESWHVEPLFGQPHTSEGSETTGVSGGVSALRFSTTFANVDRGDLFAGDCVRLIHRGQWDLEPFGRLRFRFEGQGSGHVASLWLVDVKGDEELLWRARDTKPGRLDVSVPISFEGNDVFDPGHVVAVCLELDEGNIRAERVNRFAGAIVGPVFDRRGVLERPQGYAAALALAKGAMREVTEAMGQSPAPLRARGFHPWTRPAFRYGTGTTAEPIGMNGPPKEAAHCVAPSSSTRTGWVMPQ